MMVIEMIEIKAKMMRGFWKPKLETAWTAKISFQDPNQEFKMRQDLNMAGDTLEITVDSHWDYGTTQEGVYFRTVENHNVTKIIPWSVCRLVESKYS